MHIVNASCKYISILSTYVYSPYNLKNRIFKSISKICWRYQMNSVHLLALVEGCKVSITCLYMHLVQTGNERSPIILTPKRNVSKQYILIHMEILPNGFKTHGMGVKAALIYSYLLEYVPNKYETQEMFNEAGHIGPTSFFLVSDCFKTQDMWIGVVGLDPWVLAYVSDHFKTQEICDDAVNLNSFSLKYFSD